MNEITLAGTHWKFDDSQPLGSAGGFGAVFAGSAHDGSPVAIKRLHTQALAGRELQIAEYLTGHDRAHVIPILAAGLAEAGRHYFIVMARAERSLADLIESKGPLPEADAIEIIAAIVTALAEIQELVHRDLKPANVLMHNGVWKLADLGLARFVEASTSANTMKDFLSAPYAAPEQWQGERVTKATDVYALGCINYALLTGKPPFSGHSHADYSEAHRLRSPPALVATPALQRLSLACLAKRPELRPSVDSLRSQIERIRTSSLISPANPIVSASAKVAERAAHAEAEQLQRRKAEQDRTAAAEDARNQLSQIVDGIINDVLQSAPNASRSHGNGYFREKPPHFRQPYNRGVALGNARLIFAIPYDHHDLYHQMGSKWDVLVGGVVMVGDERSCDRSANLWFAKIEPDDHYRWWEAGYMQADSDDYPKSLRRTAPSAPFAVCDCHLWGRQFIGVHGVSRGWFKLAYNPRPIDGEFFDDWVAKWSHRFANVVTKGVSPSTVVPEEPVDNRFRYTKPVWYP